MIPKTKSDHYSYQIQRLIRDGKQFALKRAKKLALEWNNQDPANGFPYMYLGLLALAGGEASKALEFYEKAIEIDPSQIEFWWNKAVSLARVGDRNGALDTANVAIGLSNKVAEEMASLTLLGTLLMEGRMLEESVQIFRKIVQAGYQSDEFVIALWMTGRQEEALNLILESSHFPTLEVFKVSMGSQQRRLKSFFDKLLGSLQEFLEEGYTPKQILFALNTPPEVIEPGTNEYIEWWNEQLEDDYWFQNTQKVLERFSASDEQEHFQEERKILTVKELADIVTRIDGFRKLQGGWFDGVEGVAFQESHLLFLEDILYNLHECSVATPYLYPSLEGGIEFEWSLGDWELSGVCDFAQMKMELIADHMMTNEDKKVLIDMREVGFERLIAEFLLSFDKATCEAHA